MSVLESFSKKVGQTARAAAKKSNELVEVTKLNMNIGNEEDKIKRTYAEIGKLVYTMFKDGEELPEELEEHCEKINGYNSSIDEMKQKIMELKNVKLCPGCNAELEREIAFCPKCGAKQEIPQPAAPAEECVEQCEEIKCNACGEVNPAGAAFCSACGNKL